MGYFVGVGGVNDIDGEDNDSEQLFMCVYGGGGFRQARFRCDLTLRYSGQGLWLKTILFTVCYYC